MLLRQLDGRDVIIVFTCRRQVLKTWKSKSMLEATYRNLLQLFCEANHCDCTEAVCKVLIKRSTET